MSNGGRGPYEGSGRKLVIAIDVGTTFTAASFCILQNGKVPKFEEVLRWPKQVTPDAKVPSVIYYDESGTPRAFGAETEDEDYVVDAETNKWFKSEWWKLHLRPPHLPIIPGLKLPPLPPHITADDIFAHYFGYVKDRCRDYITATYGDGKNIWETLHPTMYVILTTPNAWEGIQQNRMRQAAIKAGLVDANGRRRIRFVSEAEACIRSAAVLYATESGCINDWLVEGGNLILCDCGGGTVDITGYKIKSLSPLRLEEAAASRCYLAGSVFVTQEAREYLRKKLAKSEWGSEDALQRAVQHFDRNAKKKFDSPDTASWVQLDGFSNNTKLGVVRGRLKIPGKDVASFFEPCLKLIKERLEIAFENGEQSADKIILVGGFASSPYVYSQLVAWGDEFGVSVSRPDGPTTKAVANGALAWHIDNTVSSRVSRFHYWIAIAIPYDPNCKESQGRPTSVDVTGLTTVTNVWSNILMKNSHVQAGKEFIKPYSIGWPESNEEYMYSVDVYAYRRAVPPKFTTFPGNKGGRLHPGFEVICTVEANLERCVKSTSVMISATGKRYRRVNFQMCLSLGETELTAWMRWEEDGEQVYGDATVVYD